MIISTTIDHSRIRVSTHHFPLTTKVVGLHGKASIAADVYFPHHMQHPPVLFLLVAGDTFNRKAYWDLEIGDGSYSCARYLAGQGFAVATFDSLGVGESVCELNGYELRPEIMAEALHDAQAQLRSKLTDGTLVLGQPLTPFTVLVGHSTAALQAVIAQAHKQSADALIIQNMPDIPSAIPGFTEEVNRQLNSCNAVGYLKPPPEFFYPFFYGSYPPPAPLLAAIDRMAEPVPAQLLRSLYGAGVLAEYASDIEVPVLLTFAEEDPVLDPLYELSVYQRSPSRSLFIQAQAAHCGNFAPTRRELWLCMVQFAQWARSIAPIIAEAKQSITSV